MDERTRGGAGVLSLAMSELAADFTHDFVMFAEASWGAARRWIRPRPSTKHRPGSKGYIASVNPSFGGPKPNLQIAYDELKKR